MTLNRFGTGSDKRDLKGIKVKKKRYLDKRKKLALVNIS